MPTEHKKWRVCAFIGDLKDDHMQGSSLVFLCRLLLDQRSLI